MESCPLSPANALAYLAKAGGRKDNQVLQVAQIPHTSITGRLALNPAIPTAVRRLFAIVSLSI